MNTVVKNIERVASEQISNLADFGVATIYEAQGRSGLLNSRLRPIYPDASIIGPAVTVQVPPGDNWMLHVAVEVCQAGDVLVVAPTSPCEDGYFGELLASSLKSRGVIGLVIDAGCRDTKELKNMQFPVWSRAISARGTVKETLGSVNTPIVCADEVVRPGDIVAADNDGIVIVERTRVEEVIQKCKDRIKREKEIMKQLESGELGLDIYGMRDRLKQKGLKYI